MKTRPVELPQGGKKQCVREALETLGLNTNFSAAGKWIKDTYGTDISEPTFYLMRREMQQVPAPQPKPSTETETAKVVQPQEKKTPSPASQEGVADLVTKAKELIGQLGKQEAKKLIDAL